MGTGESVSAHVLTLVHINPARACQWRVFHAFHAMIFATWRRACYISELDIFL